MSTDNYVHVCAELCNACSQCRYTEYQQTQCHYAEYQYANCRYAECQYAEWRGTL